MIGWEGTGRAVQARPAISCRGDRNNAKGDDREDRFEEQAIAIGDLIEERMEAEYARLLAARKPDPRSPNTAMPRISAEAPNASAQGLYRPSWMTESARGAGEGVRVRGGVRRHDA